MKKEAGVGPFKKNISAITGYLKNTFDQLQFEIYLNEQLKNLRVFKK